MDVLKEKMDGIYGWSVKGGKVEPPKHTFPKAVKDRADYFAEMLEDGMTFLGCLDCIFSNEKPDDYYWGASKDWIPKSKEFQEWESQGPLLSQNEMAVYLLYDNWEEKGDED
ncbi:hypothetical protein CAC02_06705 [Streptococcus gallolyticus]|uniref:Phage protein n=1 Tax=Streptococcus gallolyticus TaxID=315405 RepID=A0A368UCV6_9STRE|nr:hypothetical protein [Streptococcus gallolyticus]RCW16796.1 hypothetical protein CAC02_06705 [Streptococcus gallolyticus]